MKKKTILIILAALILAAALGLGLHELLIERSYKETETTLTVEEGCTLHVDTTVVRGSIHVRVEGEDSKNSTFTQAPNGSTHVQAGSGRVCFDEVLTKSYSCAVKAFSTEEYRVQVDYIGAAGRTDIYITDSDGTRKS